MAISNKIVRLYSRLGKIAGLSLISQGASALAILAVAKTGLHNSDVYSLGIQIGTGPFSGYVLGVVYLLAIGRPSFNSWTAQKGISAAFSFVLLVATCAAFISKNSHPGNLLSILAVFSLFAFGSYFLAAKGIGAVRSACLGNPNQLASATIIPNLTMAFAGYLAIVFRIRSDLRLVIPALAWAIAAASTHFLQRPQFAVASLPDQDGPGARASSRETFRHGIYLALGVITSTLIPIAYGSAIASLRQGTLTLLFLGTRIGNVAVNTLVNSLLMVKYNWNTEAKVSTSFSRLLAAIVLLTVTINNALLAIYLGGPVGPLGYYVVPAVAWLAGTFISPILLRHLNASRMVSHIASKTVMDLLLACLSAAALFRHPSISGFFSALTLSSCTTGFICALAFKDRMLAILTLASGILCLPLIVNGF